MEQKLIGASIETPLGEMYALTDESHVHLLEFIDRKGFDKQLARFQLSPSLLPSTGDSPLLSQLRSELASYFLGQRQVFTVPYALTGTDFQKKVWEALATIPFGETRSYADIACAIGRPSAVRAVATANASNCLSLIVPCHRVIRLGGALGGYAGGLERKQHLLDLESRLV